MFHDAFAGRVSFRRALPKGVGLGLGKSAASIWKPGSCGGWLFVEGLGKGQTEGLLPYRRAANY